MKVYIDTDPGLDDAFALGYLLSQKDLEIVGIGSVSGNVHGSKASKNLKLIVSILRPEIRIFKGCVDFLVENNSKNAEHCHGADGIGDFWNSKFCLENKDRIDKAFNACEFSDKSAVFELIELSKKYEGELVILALGPLTNIAVAQLIDEEIGTRIKEIWIMGGSIRGPGNSPTYIGAEFNFGMDPESVQIVLSRMKCPKWVYPIDAVGSPHMHKDVFAKWDENEIFKNFLDICFDHMGCADKQNTLYDLNCAVMLLHRETIVKWSPRKAIIELNSHISRGTVIYDDELVSETDNMKINIRNQVSNIFLIEEMNKMKVLDYIMNKL